MGLPNPATSFQLFRTNIAEGMIPTQNSFRTTEMKIGSRPGVSNEEGVCVSNVYTVKFRCSVQL